jgi:NAD(P)-dependent dehydrogenase (short-subunit alcohol dehydrogenase family)
MLTNTAAADEPVVFITGAGSGMGRLAARRALAAGWKVAALDVDARRLEQLGDSPRLLKLPADVASAEAMREAAQRVERELGPIRRVLNAAAIMPLGLALEQAPETARRIMSINYFGLVHVAQATLPAMLARGRGEFVSFSSMAGLMPTIYVAAYDASKSAVTAYTEVLAQENRGRGVRFACVCPPMVATPLLDQARATVWPRIFSLLPPLKPERVLDDIERALRRGRFWVLPGPVTALIAWCRRLSPGLVWWVNRLLERR